MIKPPAILSSYARCRRVLAAVAMVVASFLSLAMPHHFAGKPCYVQSMHQDHHQTTGNTGQDRSTALTDGACLIYCAGVPILLPIQAISASPLWRGLAVPLRHTPIAHLYRLDRPPKILS